MQKIVLPENRPTRALEAARDHLEALPPAATRREALRYVRLALNALAGEAPSEVEPGAPSEPLSDRERQVLELLGAGHRAMDVAAQLSLSIKTVSTYRTRAMHKLGLRTTGQLIAYAVVHGYAG
jgi:DNA-binding CsgD family transcriptional regulator